MGLVLLKMLDHFWQKMSKFEKCIYTKAYLHGKYDGAILAIQEYHSNNSISKIKKMIELYPTIKPEHSIHNIIKSINKIYEYNKNMNIPISYCIFFALENLENGDITPEIINEMWDSMRSIRNNKFNFD